jgi:maltose O-acetyltransferase
MPETMKLNSSLYAIMNNLLNVLPGFGRADALRGLLARTALKGCGRRLRISCHVLILNPGKVTLGDNVYIGPGCYFGGGEIVLDDEVNIGPFAVVAAGKHTMRDGSYRYGPYEYGQIRIGRGTWVCANTVIASGVTIGKGCLVAAGSLVTNNVPDYGVVCGVPAKLLRTLPPEDAESVPAQEKGSA